MGVVRPCGLFSSSRNDEGSLDSHMSILPLHSRVQSAHGTGKSLHGLFGQQEVGPGWLWGGKVHGVIYLGLWRGPDIAAAHSHSRMLGTGARNSPLRFGEPRQVLWEGGGSVGWTWLLSLLVHLPAHFL